MESCNIPPTRVTYSQKLHRKVCLYVYAIVEMICVVTNDFCLSSTSKISFDTAVFECSGSRSVLCRLSCCVVRSLGVLVVPWHYICFVSGMCSAALPFILLGDAFDCVTLDVCERSFSYVENNVALWTSVCWLHCIWPSTFLIDLVWQPLLYSSGKNFLLRMCNGKMEIVGSFSWFIEECTDTTDWPTDKVDDWLAGDL